MGNVIIKKYSLAWSPSTKTGTITVYFKRENGSRGSDELSFDDPSNFLVISQMLRHEENVGFDDTSKEFLSSTDNVGDDL